MPAIEETKARILESARDLVQTQGYSGFTYNDIADRIGIETASIENHFPRKADLGAAVAARYRDAFMEQLRAAESAAGSAIDVLRSYAGLFRKALVEDGRMCLCGMLGAEAPSLPSEVALEVRRFFDSNLDWLTSVLERGKARRELDLESPAATEASLLIAVLEGAMVIARSTERVEIFDESVDAALGRYRVKA